MTIQAICLALLLGLSSDSPRRSEADAQGQPRARSSGGATQWMSPSVVATWLTRRVDAGPEQLELLVLWRGDPGWFLRPGNEIRSDSRSPTVGRHTIVYGDIRLTLDYDHSTRSAVVNGNTLTLGEHNVVLVDEVDVPSGPRVVRTFRVVPEMPGSAGQLSPLLTRSPEIMTFLRCDAPIPADKPRLILERLCLTNLGVTR
jgi:hypothetical protein